MPSRGRRRSLGALGAIVIAVGIVGGMSATPTSARPTSGGPVDPTIGPLVAGTSSYVNGTFAWTDYALDDRGPNLSETAVIGPVRCTSPGAPDCSGGDATYPEWAAPGGTADLIQLQLSHSGPRLDVRAVLGSLVDPHVPLLGVALDTDADPSTGAPEVPGGRWPATDPLGVDTLVIVSSDGPQVWQYADDAWAPLSAPPGHLKGGVDPTLNTMDAAVHRSVLPAMSGEWRAFGVLGVRNPDGGSWLDGSEEIFDLAFVGEEPFVRWQDNRQADILAGPRAPTHDGLPSDHAAAVINHDSIAGEVTELADGTSAGFHTYLFRSALDLPEGTNPVGNSFEYLGRYQPYLVFVPEVKPAGDPLMVSLHGANNNHMQSIFAVGIGYVGTARQGTEDPYLVSMFQADFDAVQTLPQTLVIYPLGRGETLGYRGISELDVLEATDDAVSRLGVDPDRVTLQGSSMGGSGSYHLGVAYPDRWAAIIPVISNGGAVRHLFENLRNVPVRQINGFLDSPASGPGSEDDAIRLDELGYDHRYWLLHQRGHEVPAYTVCVFDETTMAAVRDTNPSHVVYDVDPARFVSDPDRGIEIRYSSAYWVSGIATRGAGPGTVDARSLARPHATLTAVRSTEVLGNTTEGRDLCGPNEVFAPGWSPVHPGGETWLARSLFNVPGAPQPTSNVLEAALTNLSTVTFDLGRAGFAQDQAGELRISTDGPVAVTVAGLDRGTKVGGKPVAGRDATRTISLPAGDHVIAVGR